MNWEAIQDVLVALIMGAIGGGITGAIVAHYLAKSRDAENRRHLKIATQDDRRRDFLKVAGAWRTKAARCIDPHELRDDFEAFAMGFGGGCKAVSDAIPEATRTEFQRLCEEIVSMTEEEIETEEGNANFLVKIGRVIELAKL